MTIEVNRTSPLAVVFVVVVLFVGGFALALWGRPAGQVVARVVGTLSIAIGLLFLTSRNLFKRDAGVPAARQRPVEHRLRMQMRTVGASSVLAGVAQFVPDSGMRAGLMLCAGAVAMAGALRVPRRFFVLDERAD